MQTLPFTITPDDNAQPAVGLIVLQTDETMEHELKLWLPAHYRLFHSRIANSQHIDESSLKNMQAGLASSAALLPSHTQFRVIVYGCTSASTVIGEQAVADAINKIFPDCAVTNPISAIKAQLRDIQAKRIALLTPYEPHVSAALYENLENSGFQVAVAGSFNETLDHRVARISRESLLNSIHGLAEQADIDALVASCTNLRTFDIIQEASDDIGCPVISSNSALAWYIQELASQAQS